MADSESIVAHNEPELPPLPVGTRPTLRFSRKRTIDEVLYNASSDPPLFSSDDASSTVENYTYQRPKRLHKGTWWSSQEQSGSISKDKKQEKRVFTRNFDSGIWMGSDSSFGESEIPSDAISTAHDENTAKQRCKVLHVKDLLVLAQESEIPEMSEAHQRVAKTVERAVYTGVPNLDFSSMALESLPWRILKPLETFVQEPTEPYQPLRSNFRIYLGPNRLTKVPEELFTLSGVSILSLRNNKLQELSPAIRLMAPNLKELNLSVNRLNYLPWQILDLRPSTTANVGQCVLRLSGNPFYRPVYLSKSPYQKEEDFTLSKAQCSQPQTIVISRVAYMDISGQSINGPMPSREHEATPISSTQRLTGLPQRGRVPSLYELALRSSTVYPVKPLLQCLGDEVPDTLVQNLETASEQSKTGYQQCSICRRSFSIARTEWIEWQSRISSHDQVPLLKRGCSWTCLPRFNNLPAGATNCGWTAIEKEAFDQT